MSSFDSQDPNAWKARAWQAAREDRADVALDCFRQITRLAPHQAVAWANVATMHARLGQFAEAASHYREALQREPMNLGLHKYLVRMLRKDRQFEAAEVACEAAMRIKADDPELLQLLGNTLHELGQGDAAVATLERAIAVGGRTQSLLNSLGISLFRRGDMTDAIRCFHEAILLDPSFPDAHFNLGTSLLLMGDYESGWQEYEWRVGGRMNFTPRQLRMWHGEPMEGKTLLLAAEQGMGDTVQFVRFAPAIKERYRCQTILYCQAGLLPLLQSCAGIDAWTSHRAPLPPADAHIPLLSLPSLLRFFPDPTTAPRGYLAPSETLVESWRKRLEAIAPTTDGSRLLRVGLSWQGDSKYPGDRFRSMALTLFRPLLELNHIQLFSLQKGLGTEQLQELGQERRIVDFGEELDRSQGAFSDSAAIMKNLDLVVTTDTALAHVAGAIGVPVWVALARVPDWRWLFDRRDSPWYPTARLFRQPRLGDWESVVAEIVKELRGEGAKIL